MGIGKRRSKERAKLKRIARAEERANHAFEEKCRDYRQFTKEFTKMTMQRPAVRL